MTRDSFKVFTLHPLHASQMGLAQASTHSSDATWLDLEFCADAEAAEDALGRLVNQGAHGLGLRVTPERLELARRLQAFAPRAIASWIVAGPAVQRAALLGALPQLGDGKLLIEITDATELDGLAHQPDGWVVRGHEAGGWVGADTSFILLQKVMAAAPQAPVYALGGIGTHSAAACRAAGAAGVVLTDSLLLLRESHLPFALAASLARLDGSETRLLAERDGCGCRVYAPPGSSALREMETRLQAPPTEHPQGANPDDATRATLFAACGWTATPSLLPVGQEIGFAARYRTRYGSLGRLVQAVRRAAIHHVEAAARLQHLAPGAPLARAHGTRFPLAQGPMTRVSDSAAFAAAVAQAGALPFLAMALMRGPQVAAMLKATREACQTMAGELPWGVGMLGFVPHALRQEQCEAIWACKPPYALIAGGRPDQAAEFEKHGISTYIHAPAPALLKLYLEQGARRFVFEGRECGGHIGPIASFVLWEEAIDTLLDVVKRGHEDEVHVLFAGGVHDALSGAMLATMTAPLAARGFKVGALMGTAYLFTDEIVSSGAVVPGFQQEALACRRTASLETGPGHTTRCADTRFAHEFHATRTRLLGEGTDPNALRDALEDLNLGRLRIAAKGLTRDAEGQLVTVDEPHQHHDGMYMIGQAATLAHHTQPIAALHESVTVDALQRLRDCDAQVAPEPPRACPAHVAIVGIGTLLPGADHVDAYWNNILQQVSAIREVPQTRWDWQLYYDADRHAKDRVYSRWGGFLDEVPFDPLAYGIPPKSMKRIDPLQLLTLEVVRRGLEDAGWSMARDADNDFDRDNTSIILGTSGGLGDLGTQYAVRAEIPRFIDNPSPEVWRRLPEWSEESFAGSLLNVAAGRVANRMDLGGINMTCDAACASSLAAISIAVNELTSGRSNVAIAGGVDTVQTPFGYLCFSTTQALSPRGKPEAFDQNADGIVISEGLAIVVLKRLADAERDGDRIYAVIEALAGSSDGKALGMTAPRPFGQKRALYRAYQRAGFSPTTLSMIEAHGTGTAVGDKAEAQTITEALGEYHAAPRSVAVGSVKALLGHTKAAAGVVGLTKVALSLYHRTLPGHAAAQHPIEVLADPQSPACLLRQPLPWLADPRHPRRGASSAFGFGGTNFHAVLEEYRGPTQGVAGGARWPWELIILSAADGASLAAECKQLATALRQQPDFTLRDLAATLAAQRPRALRVALVAHDFASLADDLDALHAHFAAQQPLPAAARGGQPGTLIAADSVAFLFPGQGAQYVGMGREVALYCEELRAALELADRQLLPRFPQRLSQRILPPTAFVPAEQDAQKAALTDTRVAQPAIGAVSLGYLWLARRLALHAGATAGHSYGEYAALLAAGVLGAEDFLELSAVRGQAMAMAATAENVDHGTMAAINAPRHVVEALIKEYTELRVANHNAPEQSVISGDVADIEAVLERCRAQGIRASRLPVSAAFHTPRMNGARAPLTAAIHAAHFNTPRATVYSNTLGAAYPSDVDAIRAQLDEHLLSSVEFVQEIGAMYDAGARVFIEVGPKNICTGLAQRILAGHDDVHCVALDGNGGGLRGLLLGLAELWSAGVALDLGQLFDGRDAHTLDLRQLPQKDTAKLPRHLWMVSGGCARPIGDPVIRTGELPALTRRDVDALRAQAAAEAATPPPAPMGTAVARFTAPVTDASQATQGTTSAAAPLPPPPANGPLATEAIVAYQQTMRQFLALQEHVLQQFLGGNAAATQSGLPAQPFAAANSLAASAPSPLAVPAVVPSVQLPPASPAAEEFITGVHAETPKASSSPAPVPVNIARTLLDIVAERTGYPPEMLDQNADLEADLGIDSIKRVEILGALQKALPTATGVAMQAAMERFTKARSLAAIVTGIEQLGPVQAPVPTPAAVPVASPVAAATDVTALLTGIVADRTGYPPEMLDQNADLEADLGIDSIKRVEILGALQKALPTATGVAMQAAMERFTKARSLAAIVAELEQLGPVQAPVPTPAAVPVASPVAAAADVTALLTGIVADRTGYPPEMLDQNADLEADLGIDSIKRVEILGALQKALPTATGVAMQAAMERFTKARSLAAIVAELEQLGQSTRAAQTATSETLPPPTVASPSTATALPAVSTPQTVPASAARSDAHAAGMPASSLAEATAASADPGAVDAPEAAPAPAPVAEAVPRFLIRMASRPLPQARTDSDGPVLIIGGPSAVVQTLAEQLKTHGMTPLVVSSLNDSDLGAAVEEALAAHGRITAILHLPGLNCGSIDGGTCDIPERDPGICCVMSLFHVVQQLAARSETQLERLTLIAATRLGGSFGRDSDGAGAPVSGGTVGILNCLQQEYPHARCRSVDFGAQAAAEIANALVDEILSDDDALEIGYGEAGRSAPVTVAQPLQDNAFAPHLEPQAGWVVLATGGARGITAEVLDGIAGDGVRLVLIGRSPQPVDESPATAELDTADALRKHFVAAALASGEKPTPVQISHQVEALLKAREIRGNLTRLAARGAQVEYHNCDVRDAEAFAGLIDETYAAHGRIDLVVHAAGVIEDKLLPEKSRASFARVFGTKVDPALTLLRSLRPDSLKALVFFTSVAGRYGNRGQIDYAAGNEALNRVAWAASRQWPQTRVLAINWGPWDAGMASTAVRQAFRERGVDPIAVPDGRRYFAQELALGARRDVEIVAGDGPWKHAAVDGEARSPAASPEPVAAETEQQPLIDTAPRMGPGGHVSFDHRFTLEADPYLADHCIDGKAVVPAAMAIEYMAEFVAAAWPGWQVTGLEDIRQLTGIVLDNEAGRATQLRGRASTHSDTTSQQVSVEIIDPESKRPFYRATATLEPQVAPAPMAAAVASLSDTAEALDGARIYRDILFHGPSFQLIECIDGLDATGIDGRVRSTAPADLVNRSFAYRWLFDPGLVDVPPQLALVWGRLRHDMGALPAHFGSIRRYGADHLPAELSLALRLKPGAGEHSVVYDAAFVDANGRLRLAIVDGESTLSAALKRLSPAVEGHVAGLAMQPAPHAP